MSKHNLKRVVVRKCVVCKNKFTPTRFKFSNRQTVCSDKCKNKRDRKAMLVRNPTYYKMRNQINKSWFIKYNRELKMRVLAGYGGRCECCSETTKEFLSIDHIKGGGREHRASVKSNFYMWLIKNKYPKGFRILCMNCNFGRRFTKGKRCPHESERR